MCKALTRRCGLSCSQFIYVTVSFPGPPKVEADKASHVRSSWASFRPASPAPYRPSLNSPPRSPVRELRYSCIRTYSAAARDGDKEWVCAPSYLMRVCL